MDPMDSQSTHYTVLARRFRPQTFDEVIGQEHVAGGLQNAINTGRVAHAYLFTGARGVGKTSMARILAKTLNCPSPRDNQPCHECDVCQSIAAGQDVDVLEIDGASNRRIDDIRDLRRNVGVKSMRSPYKIYIIDEVHQLTTEAFNALLKTLEEPPENVKFVFCTTEPNALPETIVSRCQRFDFGLIGLDLIAARLKTIAESEGVAVSDEAVELVARRSGGSMRDSQSMFDQLLAFGQEQVEASDVHRLLGTAPDLLLLAIIEPLVEQRPRDAIAAFESALAAGAQQDELIGQLVECTRDLMVAATGAGVEALRSVGPSTAATLHGMAAGWGVETAIAAMQVLGETVSRARWTRQTRALVDLALVRIATLEHLTAVSHWLKQIADGQTPNTAAPTPDQSIQKKTTEPLELTPADSPSTPPPAPATLSKTTPTAVSEAVHTEPVSEPVLEPVPDVVESDASVEADPDVSPIAGVDDAVEPPAVEPPVVEPPVERTLFEAGCEQRIWSEVTGRISGLLREHVERVDHVAISGPSRLDLVFAAEYDFHRRFCERPEEMRRLEQLLQDVTGGVIQVRLIVEEAKVESVSEESVVEVDESPREADPMVEEAENIFGATLQRVVPVNRPNRSE